MTDGSLPKGRRKVSRNLVIVLGMMAISGIIGVVLAEGKVPFEKKIELGTAEPKSITDGKYVIQYQTTGPELLTFYLSCGPTGYWDALGPYNNCIVMPYDGKEGVVQLEMPTSLVREFDGLTAAGKIGEVQGGFYKQLVFERISEDESYTVIRVELPAGQSPIKIIGTQTNPSPLAGYAFNALIMSILVFGGLMIVWYGSIGGIKKVRQRLANNQQPRFFQ